MAAHDVLPNRFSGKGTHGLQDFNFLVAHGGGVESGGSFHGDERGQLQDVALNHVAHGASGFVEGGATLDAEGFGSGDLDAVDIITVPERLENSVAEAKDQHVLDGFFAEVVIDAVNLRFIEGFQNLGVKFLGRGQVPAERLFDDDARPGFIALRFSEIGFLQLLNDVSVNFGWRGQIKQAVASESAFFVELFQAFG